jgi:putative SOS response-associated peptidase YedK
MYAEMFGVASVPDVPSFNIAPTQPVAIVRQAADHRECVLVVWGLIPFWSKDKKTSFINARADTVLQKPAFRNLVKKRRCLVLADGFYEWKTEGKAKQPYYFHLRDGRPFAFAGLWDCWKGEAAPLESCTIITTDANELSRPIHDRMPVILTRDACAAWLDPEIEDSVVLQNLLKPYPAAEMESYAVGALVGNVQNNRPECIERVA